MTPKTVAALALSALVGLSVTLGVALSSSSSSSPPLVTYNASYDATVEEDCVNMFGPAECQATFFRTKQCMQFMLIDVYAFRQGVKSGGSLYAACQAAPAQVSLHAISQCYVRNGNVVGVDGELLWQKDSETDDPYRSRYWSNLRIFPGLIHPKARQYEGKIFAYTRTDTGERWNSTAIFLQCQAECLAEGTQCPAVSDTYTTTQAAYS